MGAVVYSLGPPENHVRTVSKSMTKFKLTFAPRSSGVSSTFGFCIVIGGSLTCSLSTNTVSEPIAAGIPLSKFATRE